MDALVIGKLIIALGGAVFLGGLVGMILVRRKIDHIVSGRLHGPQQRRG